MVLPQCGKQALQCHGIVCVIDHQGELIRNLHHLDTAFHLCYLQRLDDIFLRHLEMAADGNGCQGIINAEFSRNIDFHRKIHKPFHVIGNSKVSLSSHQLRVRSTQICFRGKSVRFQCTGVSLNDSVKMFVIAIYDSHTTLL